MNSNAARTDWRAAHGAARDGGAQVVLESPRDRDLSPATPPIADRPDRSSHGKFLPLNRIARLPRARVGKTGALHALEAKADPAWQAVRRAGRRAAKRRITEFCQSHGTNLSSGVCALVYEAAEMRADASYLRARAAADNDPDLLKVAATVSAGARQSERDAWEFAARESQANPVDPIEALNRRLGIK